MRWLACADAHRALAQCRALGLQNVAAVTAAVFWDMHARLDGHT